jgi:hypothetical protein
MVFAKIGINQATDVIEASFISQEQYHKRENLLSRVPFNEHNSNNVFSVSIYKNNAFPFLFRLPGKPFQKRQPVFTFSHL